MSDFFRGAMTTDCPEFASKFAKPETKKIYTLNKAVNFPVQKFTPSKEDTYVFRDTETNKWYDIDGKEIEKPANALKVRVLENSDSKIVQFPLDNLRLLYRNHSEEEIEQELENIDLLSLLMTRNIGDNDPPKTAKEALGLLLQELKQFRYYNEKIAFKLKTNADLLYCKRSSEYRTEYNTQYHDWEHIIINLATEVISSDLMRTLTNDHDTVKCSPWVDASSETALLVSRNATHSYSKRHNDKYVSPLAIASVELCENLAARMIISDWDGSWRNVLQWFDKHKKMHTVGYDYGNAYWEKYIRTANYYLLSCLVRASDPNYKVIKTPLDLQYLTITEHKMYDQDRSLYIDAMINVLEKAIILCKEQKSLLQSVDYIACIFKAAGIENYQAKAQEHAEYLQEHTMKYIALYIDLLYGMARKTWKSPDLRHLDMPQIHTEENIDNLYAFCKEYKLEEKLEAVLTKYNMLDLIQPMPDPDAPDIPDQRNEMNTQAASQAQSMELHTSVENPDTNPNFETQLQKD